MSAREIAGRLSKARKRYVLALPTDGSFVDWKSVGMKQRRSRMALTNSGITEPRRQGAVTAFTHIRLTPLGLEVRRVLESE